MQVSTLDSTTGIAKKNLEWSEKVKSTLMLDDNTISKGKSTYNFGLEKSRLSNKWTNPVLLMAVEQQNHIWVDPGA